MADMDYRAMEEEGKYVIKYFFEMEDWLLKLMDRQDNNSLSKDERNDYADMFLIDRKEINKYSVIRFDGKTVDEKTIRAICHAAGVDDPKLTNHSGNFHLALKRGEELDKVRRLLENKELDRDAILSDYIDYLNRTPGQDKEDSELFEDDDEVGSGNGSGAQDKTITEKDTEKDGKEESSEDKENGEEEDLSGQSDDSLYVDEDSEKDAKQDESKDENHEEGIDKESLDEQDKNASETGLKENDDELEPTEESKEPSEEKAETEERKDDGLELVDDEEHPEENKAEDEERSEQDENSEIEPENKEELPAEESEQTETVSSLNNEEEQTVESANEVEVSSEQVIEDNVTSSEPVAENADYDTVDDNHSVDASVTESNESSGSAESYSTEPAYESETHYDSQTESYIDHNNVSETRDVYEQTSEEATRARIEELRESKTDGITDAPIYTVGNGSNIPQDYVPSSADSDRYQPSSSDSSSNSSNESRPETNYKPEESKTESDYKPESEKPVEIKYREINFSEIKAYDDLHKRYDNLSSGLTSTANSEGYHDTAVYTGKHSLDSPKTFMAALAFESSSKHQEGKLLADLTKEAFSTKGNSGKLDTLNSFLTANGKEAANLATKKSGEQSLDRFGQVMVARNLATKNADGTYNFDKWDREYKDIKKLVAKDEKYRKYSAPGKNQDINKASRFKPTNEEETRLREFSRKLGLADAKNNGPTIGNIAAVTEGYKKAQKNKSDSKQKRRETFKRFTRYSMKDMEVYKGYYALKGARERTKQTIKYTKVTAKLAIRSAARSAYMMTAGTAFIFGGKKGYESVKNARDKYRKGKEKLRETRNNLRDKLTLKEQRTALKEKASSLRRKTRDKIKERVKILSLFDRMKNAKWFARMKSIGAGIGKLWHRLTLLNPVNLINSIVSWLKRKIAFLAIKVIGFLSIPILVGTIVIVIISSAISTITSFFDSMDFTDDDGPDIVYESSMGQTYKKLLKQQDQWLSKMKDVEISNGYFSRKSLRFTDQYITAEEYAPTIPHIVGYSDGKFISNPFTFTPQDTSIYKQISKFDGGTEVYLEAINGTTINNIKDILCMTNEYFDMDRVGAKDSNPTSFKSTSTPETGNSGDGYATIDADEDDVYDTELASEVYAYKKYATELFTASHRQYNELEYVILPTKHTVGQSFITDVETMKENVYHSDFKEKCPDFDKGGCTVYKNFYYRPSREGVKICVYNSNGQLEYLSDMVYADDTCRPAIGINETTIAYINSAMNKHSANTKNCYYYVNSVNPMTSTAKTSTKQTVTPTIDNTTKELLTEKCGVAAVTSAGFKCVTKPDGSISYVIEWSNDVERHETHEVDDGYKTKGLFGVPVSYDSSTGKYKDSSGNLYESNQVEVKKKTVHEYWIDTTTGTTVIIWHCNGGHTGHFCGGHLKANITSRIYSFTDAMINDDEGAFNNATENYEGQTRTKTTYDETALRNAKDIFDIDRAIVHSTEMESWTGWDTSNMELAVIQYVEDWEDMYGFDVADITGSTSGALGNPFKIDFTKRITSYFGRRAAVEGAGAGATTMHQGLDIGMPAGTEIMSVCDGIVESAAWSGTTGYTVTVLITDKEGEPTGWKVCYKHIPKDMGKVNTGDVIEKGQPIGVVGGAQSGEYFGGTASNGPHLHIEVITPKGEYSNPIFYLSSYVDEEEAEVAKN